MGLIESPFTKVAVPVIVAIEGIRNNIFTIPNNKTGLMLKAMHKSGRHLNRTKNRRIRAINNKNGFDDKCPISRV